jgi:8-oxo-dGTP diphosphatase
MRRVDVVAAALIDAAGRVLVAQRPPGKSLAGLWEFPGGKIEPGEAPATALARELAEELGITVAETDLHPLSFVAHAYPDFYLLMLLYTCTAWTGEPAGDEGQPIAWHMADALNRLAMPPADLPLLMPLQAFVAGR